MFKILQIIFLVLLFGNGFWVLWKHDPMVRQEGMNPVAEAMELHK